MTNVGTAWVEIVPSARGFARKLQGEIGGDIAQAGTAGGQDYGNRFGDQATKSGKGKFRGLFSSLKATGVLAAAAAGAAVGKVLVDSIAAASDFSETQAKAGQIFGEDQMDALNEFAEGAATSLGQSKQAALDAATTFGVFGKAAGKTGEDLVGFSTEMTALASDLASFGNTSPEEAAQALGAALRGEAEPIRQYGVLLDDATLKARAMKLGLIETTTEALTPQQRVLAAQAEILHQTKDAQGDFARTSDGLANQQRILSAEWENAKIAIGTALLPVLTKAMQFVTRVAVPAIKDLFAAIDPEKFTSFARSADGATSQVVAGFRTRFRLIIDIVRDVFRIIQTLWDQYGDIWLATAIGAFRGIQQTINGVLRVIRGIVQVVLGLLTGDWRRAWRGVRNIVGGSLDVIRGLVRTSMAVVTGLIRTAGRALQNLLRGAWNGARSIVATGVRNVVEGVRALPGKLLGLVGSMKDAGRKIIRAFVDGMKNASGIVSGIAGNVWDALRGLLNDAIDKLNDALEFTIPLPKMRDVHVNIANIGHLATGTDNWRGGWSWVGEEGPELLNLPRGSQVIPNGRSMQMTGGPGTALGGFPKHMTLRVADRSFLSFLEEVADGQVASAADLNAERSRSAWSSREALSAW